MSKAYTFMKQMEAFDSIQNVKENSEKGYCDMVQSIVKQKPFGDHKFYIFQFWKRIDDESGIKKMFHQPRLTKPEPVPGTTLLRVDPQDPETCTIIWTLPNENDFGLYKHGKMFSDPFVFECIEKYQSLERAIDRIQRNLKDCKNVNIIKNLEWEYEHLLANHPLTKKEPDDLSEEQIKDVYMAVNNSHLKEKAFPCKDWLPDLLG